MNFSIVIVTYNRKKYLERCLDSLIQCFPCHEKPEVIIVFNGETSYLSQIKKRFPEFKTLYIPTNSPAAARNFGVMRANGKYIFFLDDDCTLPKDYFEHLDFTIDWDAQGGPDSTPQFASSFQKNLGLVLSSPLCMGPTYKRHTPQLKKTLEVGDETQLILCNLWFKRSLFTDENFRFPVDLFRNEENYLLKVLKIKSKTILYNPKLFVYHSRKENLRDLANSISKSGQCRSLSFLKLPNAKEVIYALPLVFLTCFIFWIFNPFSSIRYLFMLYTILIGVYSLAYHRTLSLKIIFLHYFILIVYSLGMITGMSSYYLKDLVAQKT